MMYFFKPNACLIQIYLCVSLFDHYRYLSRLCVYEFTMFCMSSIIKILEYIEYVFLAQFQFIFNKYFNFYHESRDPPMLHFYNSFLIYLIGLAFSKSLFLFISSACKCGTIRYHVFETHDISKEAYGLASHEAIKV